MKKTKKWKLINKILEKSNKKNWEEAKLEWEIVSFEDECCDSITSCVCGQKNIKYLFKIKNKETQKILFPIGSKCIRKFNSASMIETAEILEQFNNLLVKVETEDWIEFKSTIFSRKLIDYLKKKNMFFNPNFPNFTNEDNAKFAKTMFNKRSKGTFTQEDYEKKQKRESAIILKTLKPNLKSYLKNKIIYNSNYKN